MTSDNYSGRILQISNSFVFKGPVFNYSTDFPFVWDEITLPVKYGSDVGLAHRIIEEVAAGLLGEYAGYARQYWKKMVRKYLIEDANVTPVIFIRLTDNWIEFTLRFVVDYKRRKSNKTLLYQRLLEQFNATEGKVQLASATLDITAVPPLAIIQ
ncbi:MAG: mechanosensitive ion channel family protein [Phaeodactylibacter sp.]|nr:mechanosensitive ion channel family protein [Phaeodactylibacter sp.]